MLYSRTSDVLNATLILDSGMSDCEELEQILDGFVRPANFKLHPGLPFYGNRFNFFASPAMLKYHLAL